MQNVQDMELVSFNLILHSGNARSLGMEAIKLAKSKQWDLAIEKVEEGSQELLKAQKTHANILQKESSRSEIEISLLLMHSEDHFMMGQMTVDFAKEFIDLYKRVGVDNHGSK